MARKTKTAAPACVAGSVCDHFHGERMQGVLDDGSSFVWHGDDQGGGEKFQAGVMPLGMCDDGHDVRLERWMNEAMSKAGCTPAPPGYDGPRTGSASSAGRTSPLLSRHGA